MSREAKNNAWLKYNQLERKTNIWFLWGLQKLFISRKDWKRMYTWSN